MPFLAELVREKAASNRRIAQSAQMEAGHIEPLRELQQELARLRRRIARSAREMTRYTLGDVPTLRSWCQSIREVLEEGLPGPEARELLQVHLEVIGSWFGLVEQSRGMWELAAKAGASPEGLEKLDAASREIEAFKRALENILKLVTKPRPPIDPTILDEAAQRIAEGQLTVYKPTA